MDDASMVRGASECRGDAWEEMARWCAGGWRGGPPRVVLEMAQEALLASAPWMTGRGLDAPSISSLRYCSLSPLLNVSSILKEN
ncbi:hypothetical protein U1Q18_036578 [Sarracenia purpurea var. burkii]